MAAIDAGHRPPPADRPRLPWLDAARGVALAAMVAYHLAFDLDALGLANLGAATAPGWRWFARLIAGSFLALAGVSLGLAHAGGVRWGAFARRLALVAGGAGLVSLGTWAAMPGEAVAFGVLHAIAAGGVLALPFLRAPAWLAALAGALALAGPRLAAAFGAPRFDGPAWAWLGLGDPGPSLDHVPLLPWAGPLLLGLAAARLGLARGWFTAAPAPRAPGRPARALAAAGRHSLAIYLVHQPLLYGGLAALAWLVAADPAERPLRAQCEAVCRASAPAEACARSCACLVGRARAAGLWEPLKAGRFTDAQGLAFEREAAACRREAP